MEVLESLKKGLEAGVSDNELARKFFLSYQTLVFKDRQDIEYNIKDAIKRQLNVPFVSVQVTGSSKTGVSFFKKQNSLKVNLI
jgi:hypothetical protein